MSRISTLVVLVLFSLHIANAASFDTINKAIVIKNAERTVDITTQLTKVSVKLTLENTGSTPVKSFLYSLEPHLKDNLSYISAQTGDSAKLSLPVSETQVQGHVDKWFWSVDLRDALQPSKTTVVEVQLILVRQMTSHPVEITQKERQLVLYRGNHYLYSPYVTLKQSTTVELGTRSVESYSRLKPVSQSDQSIVYGPYEKIQPFSQDELEVHFESNAPRLTVTRLVRWIEVSHWGNIAVEETIDVKHTGATLKGPFSRYEYQREKSGLASVKSFKTVLPAAATHVYYRDDIGNISTSNMKVLSDSVELELRPRFPLFGGWKTHYTIGYNVPGYEYLYNSGDTFVLEMRLVDHVLDSVLIEELETVILLPEGAHDIRVKTPYPVQRHQDSLFPTYLDTKGRVVVKMTKRDVTESHIQDFQLQYTFPRVLMLSEPLLLVAVFFLLFLLVIIYVRLDFSITKDEAGESRTRLAGLCERIVAHQDRRALTYQHLDEQMARLKTSKDVNSFLSAVKGINAEYKSESSHLAELGARLKLEASDLGDKMAELHKLDKQLKELYTQQQSVYVDKLLPGKVNRQAFIDMESQLQRKKDDVADRINLVVKSIHN